MRMGVVADISAAMRTLLPAGAAVATAPVVRNTDGLWPTEEVAMGRAVPARVAEFAAGRRAARRAMAELGLPPSAIPMRADRSPEWPEAVTGSITHTGALAMAAVAPVTALAAVGIDAEPDEPLPAGVEEIVLNPEERRWCAAMAHPARAARLIFVAKEAAYKCQYALSQTLFGFDTLDIAVGAGDRLTATFTRTVAPFAAGARIEGRAARSGGLLLAAFCVTAQAGAAGEG